MSEHHATAPARADDPRFVADVAWLAQAEPLIEAGHWQAQGLVGATCQGWQTPTDRNPLSYGTSSHRLGHHFERVHERLLRAQPGVAILAMNLPIKAHGLTLGELDCLWLNANHEVIHREVAVKYYLAYRESDASHDWVGPGKVDRLDKKLARVALHQARLPALAMEKGAWPTHLPVPVHSEVLMMGALFRHLHHQAWPQAMNPRAEGGFWCTASEFVRTAKNAAVWVCLPKPWWLCPSHRVGAPHTPADVAAFAAAAPVLVAHIDPDADGVCRGRGFVVPDAWPLGAIAM
ncbi:MAG: DUF1853 family protein [Deltaproteobacteria bacterium]|nr:DUF1853 family protein [Deltaproteobacteria bacterium]